MLLIIDNYDSFVYNIVQTIDYPESDIIVKRNDEFNIEDIKKWNITHIILSPGPMSPKESGLCNEVIKKYGQTIPILGICLGHQCIGYSFGCDVNQHHEPTHGRFSNIKINESKIFKDLPKNFDVARYHSLFISDKEFNDNELRVTASSVDGTIMAVEHKKYPVYGVQFHPESILTGENGRKILKNFIDIKHSNKSEVIEHLV